MKDRLGNIFKGTYVFEWYYIVVILCYMATLITSLARPGIVATVLMCVIAVELFIKKQMNIRSIMDVLIVVYFIYKAISVIWIIKGNMPIGVYAGESVVSLLPMIFYFAGRAMDKSGKNDDKEPVSATFTDNKGLYIKLIVALTVLGVVSLIMYIAAPQFYCDYLYNWTYISKADASTMRVRMQSFTGSTVFGAVMVLGMAVSASFLGDNSSCKVFSDGKGARIFGFVAMLITMFFAVMSNQRSAMVAAAILLIYVLYIVFFVFGSIPKKKLFIGIGVAIVLFVALCLVRFDFVLKIWWRIESLPGAISQRSEQWIAAVNNMYSSWFGNGLGANGHRAIGVEGAHVIADGGLVKIYCEEGVIGFSFFIYILYLTISRGIKDMGKCFAEIAAIVMALLMSIGSNVLAFQLITPIYWFVIGRIWSDRVNIESK